MNVFLRNNFIKALLSQLFRNLKNRDGFPFASL